MHLCRSGDLPLRWLDSTTAPESRCRTASAGVKKEGPVRRASRSTDHFGGPFHLPFDIFINQ